MMIVLGLESRCGYVILLMAVYWVTEALPLPITALLPGRWTLRHCPWIIIIAKRPAFIAVYCRTGLKVHLFFKMVKRAFFCFTSI
jgi:hypothetical protein